MSASVVYLRMTPINLEIGSYYWK